MSAGNGNVVSRLGGGIVKPQARRIGLSQIVRGKISRPLRGELYGPGGVGKSTFAAGAPKPIFISGDGGTNRLDVARISPQSWKEVVESTQMLAEEKHDFETVVFDPMNWFESLLIDEILSGTGHNLKTWGGGWQAGSAEVTRRFRIFFQDVIRLWDNGMNVLFIAHSKTAPLKNPMGDGWDRYAPALLDGVQGTIFQWVDFCLFAKFEEYGSKDRKGVSTGARILYTTNKASYEAKARDGIPETLPLSWGALMNAIATADEDVMPQIEAALKDLGSSEAEAKVREELAKPNCDKVTQVEILNALKQKIGEKQS